jgi:hypothetical protein
MGPSSHLPQNCLEPRARSVRRDLSSQTVDLWAQENRDRLEKGTTTGPVVPQQETMLPSPISTIVVVVRIISNEFAVILNNKFKAIIVAISPKLM